MADKELAWMFENCFPNTECRNFYLFDNRGYTGDVVERQQRAGLALSPASQTGPVTPESD